MPRESEPEEACGQQAGEEEEQEKQAITQGKTWLEVVQTEPNCIGNIKRGTHRWMADIWGRHL